MKEGLISSNRYSFRTILVQLHWLPSVNWDVIEKKALTAEIQEAFPLCRHLTKNFQPCLTPLLFKGSELTEIGVTEDISC